MQANILPFYSPSTPCWPKMVKAVFNEEGHVAYQITRKFRTMFDNMLTPNGLGWVRVRHRNCADKFILIEHSHLIGFCYDLSDTQDGLRFFFVINVLSW